MPQNSSTIQNWQKIIKSFFSDGDLLKIDKFESSSNLSLDSLNLTQFSFFCLTANKGTKMNDFGYELANLVVQTSIKALAIEDELAYGKGYGDKKETVLVGRMCCTQSIALSQWILDSQHTPNLFLKAAEAFEAYLLYMKFKSSIIDDVSDFLYMTDDKNNIINLFKRYSKKDIDLNTIKYPIKKRSKFLYYLSNFTFEDFNNGNMYHDKVIISSLNYFYKLAKNWDLNQQHNLAYYEKMIIAYLYGKYVTGRTAPADFIQDIRGF